MNIDKEQRIKDILGQNVKIRRELREWSQEQLAEMTGVSKNTISDIETGQKFARASTLANLAEVFETDVYELLKPDDVVSDKAMDIIVNYIGKMKNAVSEIEESFLKKMGG